MEQNLQSKPVFMTDQFEVWTGKSPFIWSGPEAAAVQPVVYLLLNTKTGVIEGETRLFAQAIDWCRTMEASLTKVLQQGTEASLQDAVDAIPDPGPPSIPTSTL